MKTHRTYLAAAAAASLLSSGAATAAEKGVGVYLLGFRGPMAGFTPPPGVFLQNDLYVYSGDAGADLQLPTGGQIIANVEATAVLEMPTGVWVTPWEIAGGNLGFSATLPIGYQDIEASASLGPLAARIQDDVFTVGDPFLSGFVGWHAGNFHWQTGVAVNVPIGDYQDGEIANISFNRWATDVFATATWLDPALGLDVSGAAGVTFNDENPATNYETGTEFHLEGAVSKIFSPQFNVGLVGYYYNQLTGDSGSGARLGDFEGEVAAIGGTLGYNFQIGILPVSTRLKYFHEFDVENRLEGDAGFFTVAMPLWVPQPPAQ
jgi:hypothetical protein